MLATRSRREGVHGAGRSLLPSSPRRGAEHGGADCRLPGPLSEETKESLKGVVKRA